MTVYSEFMKMTVIYRKKWLFRYGRIEVISSNNRMISDLLFICIIFFHIYFFSEEEGQESQERIDLHLSIREFRIDDISTKNLHNPQRKVQAHLLRGPDYHVIRYIFYCCICVFRKFLLQNKNWQRVY